MYFSLSKVISLWHLRLPAELVFNLKNRRTFLNLDSLFLYGIKMYHLIFGSKVSETYIFVGFVLDRGPYVPLVVSLQDN